MPEASVKWLTHWLFIVLQAGNFLPNSVANCHYAGRCEPIQTAIASGFTV